MGATYFLFTWATRRPALHVTASFLTRYMAVNLVVWVGLGAFAGSIALALHTAASLTKLYSEQVENISLGPVEAIKATGATRMQTIIYGTDF